MLQVEDEFTAFERNSAHKAAQEEREAMKVKHRANRGSRRASMSTNSLRDKDEKIVNDMEAIAEINRTAVEADEAILKAADEKLL